MKFQMITLALLSLMILTTKADQALIDATCKKTPDYNLCETAIRFHEGGATADVPGIGLIMVDAIKQKANEALSVCSRQSAGAPVNVQQALKRCAELYKVVQERDVTVASQNVRKNPSLYEDSVDDAAAQARNCNVALNGAGAKVPELSDTNSYTIRIAAVARAII